MSLGDICHPLLNLCPVSGAGLYDTAVAMLQPNSFTRNDIEDVSFDQTMRLETDVFKTKLPAEALVRILQYLLSFKGDVVHAISRLDPCFKPETATEHFIHKYHVGSGPVSLSFAPGPETLLGPLLVCHRWHAVGSTIFYGDNKFAFSSLGE